MIVDVTFPTKSKCKGRITTTSNGGNCERTINMHAPDQVTPLNNENIFKYLIKRISDKYVTK